MQFFAIVITLSFFATSFCTSNEGYYWREYQGTIPEDALVAGQDIKGNNVFIGQVYITGAGLIVGRIIPPLHYMHAPFASFVVVGKFVKVLCGLPENFYWMPTNSTFYLTHTKDKFPVMGGHDDVIDSTLSIGRAKDRGDLKIGKIGASNRASAPLYYGDDEIEIKVESYEVLMYGQNNGTDDT